MKTFYGVAAAAFALSCVSCLSSGVAAAEQRDTFTIRVSPRGLDLTTEAGRAGFDARVRHAARWACTERGASLEAHQQAMRCTDELRQDARRQVAKRTEGGAQRLASLSR